MPQDNGVRFVIGLWAAILIGIFAQIWWLAAGGLTIWVVLFIGSFFSGGRSGGGSYDPGGPGTLNNGGDGG